MLVTLLLFGGDALGRTEPIEICHSPPGNPTNYHTISVGSHAATVHLGHGDLLGSCSANCETWCDDGNACTIDCFPDGNGECLDPPQPVDCSDGVLCTVDGCDPYPEDGGCFNTPDDSLCDMGICDPVAGCICADPPALDCSGIARITTIFPMTVNLADLDVLVDDDCTDPTDVLLSFDPAVEQTTTVVECEDGTVYGTDGEGNVGMCTFDVVNLKAPSIICLQDVTVDLDSIDGTELAGADTVVSVADTCTPTGDIGLGVAFSADADLAPGDTLMLTCADVGTQLITVVAYDNDGNSDFCEMTVTVTDTTGVCVN